MNPVKNPKKPEPLRRPAARGEASEARSFADAFHELEKITEELEGESLDLDTAIDKFERGLGLAQQLKVKLNAVEQRVEKIRKKFDTFELPEDEGEEPRSGD